MFKVDHVKHESSYDFPDEFYFLCVENSVFSAESITIQCGKIEKNELDTWGRSLARVIAEKSDFIHKEVDDEVELEIKNTKGEVILNDCRSFHQGIVTFPLKDIEVGCKFYLCAKKCLTTTSFVAS